MAKDWTQTELTAIVADYFSMLCDELCGIPYNKAVHRRALVAKLESRSEGSIEFKHCNISAVLNLLNLPSINGYKPRNNFQNSLIDSVCQWLEANPHFHNIVSADVHQTVKSTPLLSPDFEKFLTEPPIPQPKIQGTAFNRRVTKISQQNWLAKEAANKSLGLEGEKLVLSFEEHRLRSLGKKRLANQIEHTSSTVGDGTGYDILSFEESGKPRHIEVKTTRYGKETPFWLSSNELEVSIEKAESYFLYRVYNFRKLPKLFMQQGSFDSFCQLKPQQYVASF